MNIEEFIAKLQEENASSTLGSGGCGNKHTSSANTGCC